MTTEADRLVIQTLAREGALLRAEVIRYREALYVALEKLADFERERQYDRTEREATIDTAR